MREKAIVTPKLLRWARETSKISSGDIAFKLKVKEERIKSWESGEEFPSLNQLQKLSKLYRRPISVFYLPEPPDDFQTLRDFRKSGEYNDFSTALTFLIRDIQSKQLWLSEFLHAEGEEELRFIGKFNLNTQVEIIANNILSVLEIHERTQQLDVLKFWVEKIEKKGIFVSLSSNIHSHLKIDKNEVKGFAISDRYAPFIFVNSADSKSSQLFTLIHELVHLWVNASGVSSFDIVDFRNDKAINNYNPIEILCNRVTAEILMPKDEINRILKTVRFLEVETVETIAKNIKVSSFALIVRLLNLKLISNEQFINYRSVFNEKYEEYLERQEKKPKSKGGPNYYILQIRKNSKTFTSNVYGYYKSGKISGSEANKLLNIKISNFSKLEKFLYA